MSDRVDPLDWLRYERGELAEADAARVERSIAGSIEGRAQVELLRLLRANANAPASLGRSRVSPEGTSCPDEFELAELAEDRVEGAEAERIREHLGGCGHCLLLLEAALEEVAAQEAETTARAHRSGFSLLSRPVRLAAAAAVLIAVGLLLFQSPNWSGAELAEIARVEALPVRIARSAEQEDAAERARREALEHYDAGRFEDAERALRSVFEAQPTGEAGLYLGSTLLHLGRAAEAIEVLRAALPRAGEELAPEILWQLAQCALVMNDGRWARELLLELEVPESPYQRAASELLVELRRREG